MSSSLIAIADIPTISHLYKTGGLIPTSTASRDPSKPLNKKICLIRADITTLEVSAIVNAANRSLLGGGGVDGAIHNAAGPKLLRECRTLGGCNTGDAKITKAYSLPCSRVIHAVGPIYSSENQRAPGRAKTLLQSCYRKCLELAVQNECKSLAFSALSCGAYGYPSGDAAAVACAEVRRFLEEEGNEGEFEKVVFCCFTPKDENAYKAMIPKYFPATEEDAPEEPEAGESEDESEATTGEEKEGEVETGKGKEVEAEAGAGKAKEAEVEDDKPPAYEEEDSKTA
ncbi:MAG: hypothetical protein MMC33_006675 [Icmadophila ericetorum]|nr:hypothetical protein [Icmadophila ericetorum]